MTRNPITEPLSPDLVERGNVLKAHVYEADLISLSYLYLSPGAKIKTHLHITENEIYLLETGNQCTCSVNNKIYVLKNGENSVCLVGQQHDLENTSEHDIKVLSIKYQPTF